MTSALQEFPVGTDSGEMGRNPNADQDEPQGTENSWLMWQLVDSAFPSGSFAHSAGLEAAWQQGGVRDRGTLHAWVEASLEQLVRGVFPFFNATWRDPLRLRAIDRICDAFLNNHVANRASRLQGRALWSSVSRVFLPDPHSGGAGCLPRLAELMGRLDPGAEAGPCGHLAPVLGCLVHAFGIGLEPGARLLVFLHLRGVISAAVRLNLIGPMEGQRMQHRLIPVAEDVRCRGIRMGLEDLAQTAPLIDLWQSNHDRIYSRLFQS